MPDRHYTHPRLVAIYDALDPDRPGQEFVVVARTGSAPGGAAAAP